jgi:hypothetical protein
LPLATGEGPIIKQQTAMIFSQRFFLRPGEVLRMITTGIRCLVYGSS